MCALDVRSDAEIFSPELAESSALEPIPISSPLSLITEYTITHRQASESAWIFFIEDDSTRKPMVAKVLRPFNDSRYHLSDIAERQKCQLEAFSHNSIFTPEVYIGLARIYNQPSEEGSIMLGSIIQHPSPDMLEQGAEYALIMERLPDELRLDQLLRGDESSFPHHLEC